MIRIEQLIFFVVTIFALLILSMSLTSILLRYMY